MKLKASIRAIIFIFVIFAFCTTAIAQTIYFDDGHPVQTTLTQGNSLDSLTLDVKINLLQLLDENTSQGVFARLVLDDSAYIGQIGQARLPVIRKFLFVPDGAKIHVTAQGTAHLFDIENYTAARYLMPVQPSEEKCGCNAAASFAFDEESYNADKFRFKEKVKVIYTGVLRGRNFAVIEIRPVDYNPMANILTVYPEMKVDISFSGSDWKSTKEKLYRYGDVRSTTVVGLSFLNSDYLDTKTNIEYYAPSSYLVIGLSTLINSETFGQWVQWKTRKGHMVELATLAQAGTTASEIRDYIIDAYNNWETPPGFVLLVGDTNSIPSFKGSGMTAPATDLYYAAIDGNDIFADLGIGRFPARNILQLEKMVSKTLDYELGNWNNNTWLGIATFMASNDRFWITQGSHDAVCSSIFVPEGFTCEKLYSHLGATTQQVLSAINQGTVFLTYSGHGEITGWSDGPPVTATQVTALNNDIYPFVSSFSCLTGKYQTDECFAESWLRAQGGAVGMFASSVPSTWDEDDVLERGQMWGLFYGSQTPEVKENAEFLEIPWFSGFTDFGKRVLFQWASGIGSTTMYFEMYNLFGDPETMAWTSYPISISVDHKNNIPIPADKINIKVDGGFVFARVGISSGGKLLGSALVAPGVETQVPLLSEVTKEQEAHLVVSGHNFIPYQTEIKFTNDPGAGDDDDDSIDDDDSGTDDDDDDSGGTKSADDDDGDAQGACGC